MTFMKKLCYLLMNYTKWEVCDGVGKGGWEGKGGRGRRRGRFLLMWTKIKSILVQVDLFEASRRLRFGCTDRYMNYHTNKSQNELNFRIIN